MPSINSDTTLSGEFDLTNIDGLVTPSPSLISGRHLTCHSLLPSSVQKTRPFIWLGNGKKSAFRKDTSHVPAANIYEFHNVWLVAQGCICDQNHRMFTSQHLNGLSGHALKMGMNRNLLETCPLRADKIKLKNHVLVREINGPCVPLSQPGEGAYGHWLVDILPRVILAQKLGIRVKYLCGVPLPEYARTLLNLIGVTQNEIITYNPNTEAILMDVCFFPSHLRWKSGFSPLFKELRKQFLPTKPSGHARKIFVSRGNYNKVQTITNAQALHDLMSEYGIDIVEPHKHSIQDQIKLFSEARLVIGEYGSAMHNTLFSRSGTKVIVLQSDSPLPFLQAGIGAVLNQPTGFVFGRHEQNQETSGRTSHRSFHADLSLVRQAIEASI